MSKILHVLVADVKAGEVTQDENGRLTFAYDAAYQNGDEQIPLSLSMSLALQKHGDKTISPWMWNLLPDNEQTLDRWGKRFNCSPRSAFALLQGVGEDCAGAVQFLTDDKLGNPLHSDQVIWLSDADVGARLRELRDDIAAGRRRSDHGQFSLAGAQAKTAFYRDPVSGRWGVPEGRIPTTHIFKPPIPEFKGHTENEHFCLRLAQAAGLHAANSSVLEFEGEKAIVVERYDRVAADGVIYRIHQEDMCQALKVDPRNKYENQGGPGLTRIMKEVLSRSDESDLDRERFMSAATYNYLIAGTDAHAKNYSMLLDYGNVARLAPLYDIASILPHLGEGQVEAELRDIKLAMKVSDKYLMSDILPRHWETAAKSADFSPEITLALLRHHIHQLPDLLVHVADQCRQQGLGHPVIGEMVKLIGARLDSLRRVYGAEAMP